MDQFDHLTLDVDSAEIVDGEMAGVDVPRPVSSFAHVNRSAAVQPSLVPSQSFWSKGKRKSLHRSTGRS